MSWLDDHSRYALHCTAYRHVTGKIVPATFRDTYCKYGLPASTLTDIQSG